MYANAWSRGRVGEGYSEEFEVKVSVHQGSVLSQLLFIIVLEALSREFRSGVPWEDLYADDLVIIAESLEECVRRLLTWKEAMEKKGLRVNAGKTKIIICSMGLDLCRVQASFHELSVALEWAATSSAMAASTGCTRNAVGSSAWKRTLTTDVHGARELHAPLMAEHRRVQVGPDKLEVVASFCYLGDMLSATGGCELSTTTHVKIAWKKFKDLLPVLSSRHLFQNTWPCVQLLCGEHDAPCQRDLVIDKAEPPATAAK